ncbi:hypothetical protein AVEN_9605-1 [Araneus ventricosus]|uniref:Uncharacterized protein n=1 Tax=Araneus ventricosus TaxID=182803 RepID=A0A4Y2KH63_ARAVE|nr:hypothetical protein AVEN_9605-1 [Araneus ventricosus]
MLPLYIFRSSSRPCKCGCPLLCPLHLPKKFILLSCIHRDAVAQTISPFLTSSDTRVVRVRKGDVVQSSNGSGLLLNVERRYSNYDLESRGCCGSVCS